MPQSGKKPLTLMPQRVIFSPAVMPQSGKDRRHINQPALARHQRRTTGKEDRNDREEESEEGPDRASSRYAHKIWLAGLGAVAIAEEEGGKLFKGLVEKGQTSRSAARSKVDKAKGDGQPASRPWPRATGRPSSAPSTTR